MTTDKWCNPCESCDVNNDGVCKDAQRVIAIYPGNNLPQPAWCPRRTTPQLLIDDESGEPWQMIGSAANVSLTADNIRAWAEVAIELLLSGQSGDMVTLRLKREDMTEGEVDAVPEL